MADINGYGSWTVNKSRKKSGVSRLFSGNFGAHPGDSNVQGYLSQYLAGQRDLLNDYVRRAAGAAVKRGGMNVVGGPQVDSELQKSALETLAKGYSQAFKDAMDYGKYVNSTAYKRRTDKYNRKMDRLDSATGGAAARQSAAGRGSADSTALAAALKRLESISSAKQSSTPSSWDVQAAAKAEAEKRQARISAEHERQRDQDLMNQLTSKAALTSTLGKQGAGWTASDDILMEYLGVKLGFMKPQDRKVTRKAW